MNWMIENWMIVFGITAAVLIAAYAVYRFLGLPTKEQTGKIKEWLIWACIEAEKALQSGTGQLKLRQVYDMFCAVPAFTWVARLTSFAMFSDWVTEALATAKNMLVKNTALALYVYGENADAEIEKLKKQLEESSSN